MFSRIAMNKDAAAKRSSSTPALTKRMIDVVNQCKYLASKKGLTIKELRQSMREDEARQRKMIREAELHSLRMMANKRMPRRSQAHPQHPSERYPGMDDPCRTMWHAHHHHHHHHHPHCNPDGTLFSHWNMDGYGRMPEAERVPQSSRNMSTDNIEWTNKKDDDDDATTEDMTNLLYYRSKTDSSRQRTAVISKGPEVHTPPPPPTREPSKLLLANQLDDSANVFQAGSNSSLDSSSSNGSSTFLEDMSRINRPVRKMASHDLTQFKDPEETAADKDHNLNAKDSELDYMVMPSFEDFCSSDDEDEDNLETQNKDGNNVFEGKRRVVSPLLKKVESALANLQTNDSLFGTEDEFGHMMEKIL